MAGYLGHKPALGKYAVDERTSSGGNTYTLSQAPGNKNNIQVSAGGLVQYPSAYSVSGTTLTLSGVPSGQKVIIRHMGESIAYPALDADVVTGAKIADNAVDSEHYTDGSIDNIHTNFQPGTTFKGDGSSARGKIVLNCEMNTHGVSIQSPAHSAGASYTLTLPPNDGAANEVLTTDGSGVLSFAAAGGGAMVYISSVTVSSAIATAAFLSSFSSTYDVYIVRYCDVVPVTDQTYFGLRIAQGGSAVSASQYRQATTQRKTNGDSTGNGETASSEFDIHLNPSGNATGEHASGEAVFYNPLSTSSYKSVGWRNAHSVYDGTYVHNIGAGSYWSATATSGFLFRFSSGNIASGTFRLYGIVNS